MCQGPAQKQLVSLWNSLWAASRRGTPCSKAAPSWVLHCSFGRVSYMCLFEVLVSMPIEQTVVVLHVKALV